MNAMNALHGANTSISCYDVDEPPLAWFGQFAIAVVIPAYKVERQITQVLCTVPAYVRHIIVVNDASPDNSAAAIEKVAREDARIIVLHHEQNQGVGGAMVTGLTKALEIGAQIAAKMDGDGQMSPDDLPALLLPIVRGEADYTKGNRFRDFAALRQMPALRRAGNMGMSFLAKVATGYWNCFDPANGYLAIRCDILRHLPLDKLPRRFFFETSMLSHLYLLGALVREVPMPARYGDEVSNLSTGKVLREFPRYLLGCFVRRILLKNFIYDFTMESVYLLCGLPMLLIGVLYGGINWIAYARTGIGAPTGIVVIPAMLIILGFQILLAAVNLDFQAVPRRPLSSVP